MDPRTAAHALTQIASYLELRGEKRFKSRAYEQAAQALLKLDTDDLGALDRAGELAAVKGLGPATLSVVRDLVESGESRYLEQLRADTPPGLLELLRVPGLGTAKIHLLHTELGIDSVESLESAARDGSLAKLKGFGPKTAERILKGIGFMRAAGARMLFPRGAEQARVLAAMVGSHPAVRMVQVAGSVRRLRETIAGVHLVAACAGDPAEVAASFARAPGVRDVDVMSPRSPSITFVDGARLDLHCTTPADYAVALWRATGAAEHVRQVAERLAERGYALRGDEIVESSGAVAPVADEAALYALAGLAFVPPELREQGDELRAAAEGRIPELLTACQLLGVLHCHSTWSDGKASIADMAAAARERGWSYIGITDHSQAAFYAGGLSPAKVREQHDEIDELNATLDDFTVLKGIEADILADGTLDYDESVLSRFDFVVGSVHSRFNMDQATMTERVLRALDSPFLTVLGHPTGRLLLSRASYAIDLDAVLEKAAAVGVAVEINADPHRLDLDWRHIPFARDRGAVFEIGPDAHSTKGLDNVTFGVGIARKGALGADRILNARSAGEVIAFAAARRAGAR